MKTLNSPFRPAPKEGTWLYKTTKHLHGSLFNLGCTIILLPVTNLSWSSFQFADSARRTGSSQSYLQKFAQTQTGQLICIIFKRAGPHCLPTFMTKMANTNHSRLWKGCKNTPPPERGGIHGKIQCRYLIAPGMDIDGFTVHCFQ